MSFSEENTDKLESIDKTLREILKWTRFANISKLKEILEAELDSDGKRLAYENSDGENGLRELASICSAPKRTIDNWWHKWFRLGLVTESETRKGRMMKIVSLDDIGINVSRRATAEATPQGTQPQPTEADQPTPTEEERA